MSDLYNRKRIKIKLQSREQRYKNNFRFAKLFRKKTKRPVRAKALIINAFALTGRIPFIYPYTQGGALGYGLLPFQGM